MKVDASILTVLIFIGAGASAGYVIKSGIVYVPVLTDMSRNAREESVANHAWPPVLGQPYPELQLTGLDGKPVKLSDYKGRVMVIESTTDLPFSKMIVTVAEVGGLPSTS